MKRIHKISRLGACSFKHAPYLIIALFKFVAYAPWKVHIYAQYAPSKVHIYVFFFQSFKLFAKSVLYSISNNCQRFLSVCSDYSLVMEEYFAEE